MKIVTATLFIKQIDTDGHQPLFLLCDDGQKYYTKYLNSFDKKELQCLVYEMLATELLNALGIPCANDSLVKIPSILISKEIKYANSYKRSKLAWGSQEVVRADLVTQFSIPTHKNLFKMIANPEDVLKIAIFDLWTDNADRREDNYNLLKKEELGKIQILPIDHATLFGGFNRLHTFSEKDSCTIHNKLVFSEFYKNTVKHISVEKQLDIAENFLHLLTQIKIKEITHEVFSHIPESWEINENLKERIEKFLLSDFRMKSLQNLVLTILPLNSKK